MHPLYVRVPFFERNLYVVESIYSYGKKKKTKECTLMLPMYKNFQPPRPALTAKSMSSTVVLSFQPPASFMAWILHTPAVPISDRQMYSMKFLQLCICTTQRRTVIDLKRFVFCASLLLAFFQLYSFLVLIHSFSSSVRIPGNLFVL